MFENICQLLLIVPMLCLLGLLPKKCLLACFCLVPSRDSFGRSFPVSTESIQPERIAAIRRFS